MLAAGPVVFSTSAEILFGSLLIYQFRLLERHWGSTKLASFFTVTTLVATFLNLAALAVLQRPLGITHVSSGPFAFLAAAMVQYAAQIPQTYKFKVFGVTFSDQIFMYALGIQYRGFRVSLLG
eukprot:jgi/Hompol1/5894/HPOL_000330-RA